MNEALSSGEKGPGGWAEFFSIVSVGLMVAGAVLVAGILIGFLFGLPRYLKQRGSEPGSAAENPTEGELPKKDKISDNLVQEDARKKLHDLADEYMDTRRKMPRGSQRTVEMTKIVARIVALGGIADYECRELREEFGLSEGRRMIVLGSLQVKPLKECLDLVTTAITESRSAFEQYQALRAAQSVKEVLDEDQMPMLRMAIESERKDGYIIPENAGRWSMSEQILDEMRR